MLFQYEVNSLIDPDMALHLYRIIQELVHNAVKHSGASVINVHLKEQRKKLYVLCQDDGKGIDTAMPVNNIKE
ncbi:MAG: ATP-binding protein [Bacteroidota bacterium]